MKKTLFLVSCFLLIFSGISAKEIRKVENADCYDQVYMVVVQADAAGYSQEEIEFYSQVALAVYCYGYDLEDVYQNY